MSAGRGRLRRLIVQSVRGTRYGCTRRQLAYQVYRIGRLDAPTEEHLWAVDQAVRQLLDDGLVVERTMLGAQRYLFPATPPRPGSGARMLQCLDCDLRWFSEEGAPHLLCWSCGAPGIAASRNRRWSVNA
jgi:hypothetical protein